MDCDARQPLGIGCGSQWWARQDSNLQPSRYERPALPLSYRPSPALSEIDKGLRCAKRNALMGRSRPREQQRERVAAVDQIAAGDPRQAARKPQREAALDRLA